MRAPRRLESRYLDGRRRWIAPDEEWLVHQYVTLERSAGLIAKDLDTFPNKIYHWLREAEIPTRSYQEAQRARRSRNGRPLDTQTQKRRLLENEDIPFRCTWCDCDDGYGPSWKVNRLVMHHRDHDRQNGSIENLVWMCPTCHYLESWLHVARSEGKISLKALSNDQLLITLGR